MNNFKFCIYLLISFICFFFYPTVFNSIDAACTAESSSATGYTCKIDPLTLEASCVSTSVDLKCYDVGGYCAGDQYEASCTSNGSSCTFGGNTQVRCSYSGPPPPTPPPPTEPPPPTQPPQPTGEPTPTSCPNGTCETRVLSIGPPNCAAGVAYLQRTCDYGSCGRSTGAPYCAGGSGDLAEYAPVWIRINSVEGGQTVSWRGSQSKDPVKGSTWSVNPVGSDGYFTQYKATYNSPVVTFNRNINRVDESGQMDVWVADGYGDYEYWAPHFCGQGRGYGLNGSLIGGSGTQCGAVDYSGAWCKLDPATCGGTKSCLPDGDGCVDFVKGGAPALSNGALLTGYHDKLNRLLQRLSQPYDGRWASTFWTVHSIGGYRDFSPEFHLKPPAGYRCTGVTGAYVKSDGDTAAVGAGSFHMMPDGIGCYMSFDPISNGQMFVFTIARDNRIPNCSITSISNTRPRAGSTISFTTRYESPQGNIIGQLFRGSANASLSLWRTLSNYTAPAGLTSSSQTSTWYVDYPATFQIGCRAWNDSIMECRPASIVNAAVPNSCYGPDTQKTVTVLPACPTNFNAVVNSSGTSVSLSWSYIPNARAYGIRANAEPLGDWRNLAAGDRSAEAGDNSTITLNVLPNKIYHWSVEPRYDSTWPSVKGDECNATTTFSTAPVPPTAVPLSCGAISVPTSPLRVGVPFSARLSGIFATTTGCNLLFNGVSADTGTSTGTPKRCDMATTVRSGNVSYNVRATNGATSLSCASGTFCGDSAAPPFSPTRTLTCSYAGISGGIRRYNVSYIYNAVADVGCVGMNSTPYWAQLSATTAFTTALNTDNTWQGGAAGLTTSAANVNEGTTVYGHVRSRDALNNQSVWSPNTSRVLNPTNCTGVPTNTPTPTATNTPTPTNTSTPTPTPAYWYKLKDASLNKRITDPYTKVPSSPLPFNNTDPDDPAPAAGRLIIGQAGVISTNSSLSINGGGAFSVNQWYKNNYALNNPYIQDAATLNIFKETLKATKNTKTITTIANVETKKINILLEGNLTINTAIPNGPYVIFVNGNIYLNGPLPIFNPTSQSIALIATGSIFIHQNYTEANGIFIAPNIVLTSSGVIVPQQPPLKINGNIISTARVDNTIRLSSNQNSPSLFVVFKPKMYLDLLPLLSTVVTEGRQLE